MKIRITKDDIANGRPGRPDGCPIALALERETGQKWCVEAEWFGLVTKGNFVNLDDTCSLPRNARRFIDRFDARAHVRPITVDLPIVLNETAEAQ